MKLTIDQAFQRGVSAHREGNIQEAERFYQAILHSQPSHPDANHNLGVLAVSVNKFDAALSLFKTALDVNPKIDQFWVSYINTLLNLNQVEEAKTALLEAGQYCVKGDAFGQLEELIQIRQVGSTDAINQDPTQHLLASAVDLYNRGEMQQTLSKAEHMLKQYPNSAVLYNLQGAAYAGLGDSNGAVDSFRQAIKLKPDFADAYFNMGAALQGKRDLTEAIRSYRAAIQIKPDFADAFNNMGNALKEKGQLDEAINSLRQAIKLKPDHAEAHSNMGNALKEKGELDEAISSFRQSINLNPDIAEVHSNMGNVLKEKGDLDEAMDSFEQAVHLKPDLAEGFYNMGIVQKERGQLNEAIHSFAKAIDLKPDYADAYYSMGTAEQANGNLDDAVDSYERAIEISPDHQDALNNLGNTLKEKGELDQAIECYQSAIKINPDYLRAWNNLYFPLKVLGLKNSVLLNHVSLMDEGSLSQTHKIRMSLLKYLLAFGGPMAETSMAEAVEALSLMSGRVVKNTFKEEKLATPDAKLELQQTLPKKLVAMTHCGRSGTNLLHSLVDGHSMISTLPSFYFSEFFDVETWKDLVAEGWDKIIDRFISKYPVLFDSRAPDPIPSIGSSMIASMGRREGLTNLGDERNESLMLDKVKFRDVLLRLMSSYKELDALKFFTLVHQAYEKVIGNSHNKEIIFYHIHNPDTCAQLNFMAFAPQVKWLVMVREPIQSCESWIRQSFEAGDYEVVVVRILTVLFQVDSVVFNNGDSVGVRLEDLKRRPKETIRALCDWMGIIEEKSLYEMTAQGKKWWGDSSSPDLKNDHMKPFGKASINRQVGSVFSVNDEFILRTLFYPFNLRFGYADENLEQFEVNLQIIRPMLDDMFDFERAIIRETRADTQKFKNSGTYRYLRACLIDRWNVLNEFSTYPKMLKPLSIDRYINRLQD